MKKTITVLAYNRPDYLRQTLDALSQCRGLAGYDLVISVDGNSPLNFEPSKDPKTLIVRQDRNFGIDHHNGIAKVVVAPIAVPLPDGAVKHGVAASDKGRQRQPPADTPR